MDPELIAEKLSGSSRRFTT